MTNDDSDSFFFSYFFPFSEPPFCRCIQRETDPKGEDNSICVLLFRFRKSDCSLVHQDSLPLRSRRDDPRSFADVGFELREKLSVIFGWGCCTPFAAQLLKSFIAFDTANLLFGAVELFSTERGDNDFLVINDAAFFFALETHFCQMSRAPWKNGNMVWVSFRRFFYDRDIVGCV